MYAVSVFSVQSHSCLASFEFRDAFVLLLPMIPAGS
jgi:hypothetical protein